MIIDGANPEDRKKISNTKYDICIVGTGAAGFAIAYSLRDSSKNVVVLESGYENRPAPVDQSERRWFDPLVASLDEGETNSFLQEIKTRSYGRDFLTRARTRCYGGSTNCWGGWIRPLDTFDFEGWPISRTDLDDGQSVRFYRDALDLVNLGHFDLFDQPQKWIDQKLTVPDVGVLPIDEKKTGLKTVVIQQQTDPKILDFWENPKFRDLFTKYPKLTLIKNATVITCNVRHEENKFHVSNLQCGSVTFPSKHRFTISANNYILAMGGLEIPRFLLINAPGNPWFSKLFEVGKSYMNHPKYMNGAWIGLNVPFDGYNEAIRRFYAGTVPLKENPDYARAQAFVVPTEDAINKGLFGPTRNFRTAIVREANDASFTRIELNFEQSANKESEITLDYNQRADLFEQPRLKLDWNFSQQDANTVNNSMKMIRNAFSSAIYKWQQTEWIFEQNNPHPPVLDCQGTVIYPGDHHLGTCRMNSKDDAFDGVVDSNCKVLGGENLWICSTGVFPTGGWANSTFTLLALALRLADHLKQLPESPLNSTEEPFTKTIT